MMKFLIIVGILFLASMIVMNVVRKSIRNFIDGLTGRAGGNITRQRNDDGEVLFKKDGIEVLKGEAKENKKSRN